MGRWREAEVETWALYELPATETEIKLIQTAASFLGKQMES